MRLQYDRNIITSMVPVEILEDAEGRDKEEAKEILWDTFKRLHDEFDLLLLRPSEFDDF